ncbi:MAG: hypothetical protein JXR48_07540 [Candidatus Delongbacteria bacterium]|nr:hypothetical protein [Candidatus Delongbacteria bacterium]MBN2834804.1 hypothetical protein [Candidatus Delongbacteria bacterium]
MSKFILLQLFLFLIMSCQIEKAGYEIFETPDGVRVTKNKNYPNSPDFVLNKKFLFSIDQIITGGQAEGSLSRNVAVDDSNNIFYTYGGKLYKLNDKGSLVKTFGGKGFGPGELGSESIDVNGVFIINDTLSVFLEKQHKVNLYDLDGNFIESKRLDFFNFTEKNFLQFQQGITPISEQKYIRFVSFRNDKQIGTSLSIVDNNGYKLNIISNLAAKNGKMFDDVNLMMLKYTFAHNKIYVAKNSTEFFEIEVFDLSGNLAAKVKKNYKRVPLPLFLRPEGDGLLSIQSIEVDKYERIWIYSAEDINMDFMGNDKIVENGALYQLFSPDGVYINKIDLNTDEYKIIKIFFIKDKMYVVVSDADEEAKTLVFDY